MRLFQTVFTVFLLRAVSSIAVLALIFSAAATATNLQVKVVDAQQQPLAGAVVSIPAGVDLPTTTNSADNLLTAETYVMDQVDKLFVPFILVVAKGSQVVFPNRDNIRHQVFSFSPTKPFELPLYSNREQPLVRFEQAGVVVLGCNIHDHMKAYIYISPHQYSAQTDAQGQVTVPAGSTQLAVWYPGQENTVTDTLVTVRSGQTELVVQLPVSKQQQQPPPLSPLQQKFNQRKQQTLMSEQH